MKNTLNLCKISPEYLRFMHSLDNRISVKYNNRPFVGVVTIIDGLNYVLPLTSQTTKERKLEGKKKRSPILTTFVKNSKGEEIANILHNNMFPVKEGADSIISIDPEQDTYESNEIRFIRKNMTKIIEKTIKLHEKVMKQNNNFLRVTCCNFKKLEEHYQEFNS